MALDPEIEEILKSIQNSDYDKNRETSPIRLPKTEQKSEITEVESEPELPEPPKPKETAPAREEKAVKENKPKINADKKRLTVVCAAILIIAVIAGAFAMAGVLYTKRYEAKYKVDFPKGIPHEMCDAYGKNQTLAGSLKIKDNDSEHLVYSEPPEGAALFEKGSDIKSNQHYRAIALTRDMADLEALYKDAESYKKSSQSFIFTTIYGEKQKYQIIAAYIVNTDPKDDNGYAFPYNCYGNFTKKSYRNYQDTIKCRSLYTTGYKIKDTDYCITLSVPSDIMPNFRFAVVGVKVDKINKLSKVKENARVRYPQAYCDKLGVHNIYNFAYKWYPEIITNEKTGETKQLTEKDFK